MDHSQLKTILIVDDDQEIRQLLTSFLQQYGFAVLAAQDAVAMDQLLATETVDLIILDIMMPGEDGISVCRRLTAQNAPPILMLTAISEELERILALEVGADDYLSKPFNPRELLARVRAILRRTSDNTLPATQSPQSEVTYHFSGWTLNDTKRLLLSSDQVEVDLSAGEYTLLQVFLRSPQQVLSRDQLLSRTRNREAEPFDRSIDIQVSRLRQKNGREP